MSAISRLTQRLKNEVPYPEVTRKTILAAYELLFRVYNMDRSNTEGKSLTMNTPEYVKERYDQEAAGTNIHWLRTDQVDIRSYKARGAATVVLDTFQRAFSHNSDVKEGRKEGEAITKIRIVADSEGNHAQGVAKAIAIMNRYMKKKAWRAIFGNEVKELFADIVMSGNADTTKVENTRAIGGEHVAVHRADGKAYDVARLDAERRTDELQQTGGNSMLVVYNPPFNSPQTAKGAGTLGVDIEKLLGKGNEPDMIVCGIGGGGLATGLTRFFEGTKTKVVPVATSFHPATIVGMINGGEEISLRNTDRELSPIHVGGATIIKGGAVTLKMLKHADTRIESAHPEQLAWLMNEYIVKELGYSDFYAYRDARLSGEEKRKTPELAGLQSVAYLRNNPEVLKGKKNVVTIITGGNISLEGSEIDIREALETKGHKEYPRHLHTCYYDPKDLVGSLKSVVGIVDDRKELDDLAKNWEFKVQGDVKKFVHKETEKEKVMLTNELENTLYILTAKTIERIGNEVRLRRDQDTLKNELSGLINDWADAGRFNDVEKAVLLDRLKPGVRRSSTTGS